ncbi:unnamed protein product, partial [Brassica oleracea]
SSASSPSLSLLSLTSKPPPPKRIGFSPPSPISRH